MKLDSAQARAVAHEVGPALILAGPGSGKTRVIVERYCRLLQDHELEPDRILLLTFTETAAREMRERIEARIQHPLDDHFIQTFHAFSRRVLSRSGWVIGIKPFFQVPTAAQRWAILEEVLRAQGAGYLYSPIHPRQWLREIFKVIEHAKREQVTPEAYIAWAEAAVAAGNPEASRQLELGRAYQGLEARYRELGLLDFQDQLRDCLRLLESSPEVLAEYRAQFRFVMVDEFQDTDPVQSRIVELISGEAGNLMVVADDDQSIYRFRGASLANIRRFRSMYPGHAEVLLNRNYRSSPQILTASTAIIGAASMREPKEVTAVSGDGLPVVLIEAPDERSEARAVARRCRELIDDPAAPSSPLEIAILVRLHAQMPAILRALEQERVPYRVYGGRDYFRSPDVKGLIALLRAVADPDDGEALVACLRLPNFGISARGRLEITRARRRADGSLFEVLLAPPPALDEPDREIAAEVARQILLLHQDVDRVGVRDLFFNIMDSTRYAGALEYPEGVERLQALANLNKFADLVDGFCDHSPTDTLAAFLRYLELTIEAGDEDQVAEIDHEIEAVRIMTAHKSKGLEFDHVIVPSLVPGRFPVREWRDALALPLALVAEELPTGDTQLEEERRVLYVAVTRARRSLTLSWARQYPSRAPEAAPTDLILPAAGLAELRREPPAPVSDRGLRVVAEVVPEALQLSYSRLSTFAACPRRYAYRHVYHLPERPNAAAVLGMAVHRTLEIAGRQRIQGETCNGSQLQAIFAKVWRTGTEDRGTWAELEKHGAHLLGGYGDSEAWQNRRVLRVEQKVVMQQGEFRIEGRIDRLDEGHEGELVLVDYKTGRAPAALSSDHELQFALYRRAAEVAEGRPAEFEAHFLEDGVVMPFTPSPDTMRRKLARAEILAREILRAHRTRTFEPRASTWNCSQCPFRLVCDEGREILQEAAGEPAPGEIRPVVMPAG